MKFGARTGAAPVALGCVKLALGLTLGSSLAELLRAFPQPLLGSLLIFSGALPLLFLHTLQRETFRPVMAPSTRLRLWLHISSESWLGTAEV